MIDNEVECKSNNGNSSEKKSQWNHGRPCCLLMAFCTGACLLYLVQEMHETQDVFRYAKVYMEHPDVSYRHLALEKNKTTLILDWTGFFDVMTWLTNDKVKNSCPLIKDGHCEITTNKTRLREVKAVLFHWRDLKSDSDWRPKEKQPGQKWVLLNFESPIFTYPKETAQALGPRIDWTMTYRLDSEVYAPYGRMRPRKHNETQKEVQVPELTEEEFLKKKPVAWMVSNCNTPSNRHTFVTEMRKNITVDIFGKCGRPVNFCQARNDRLNCYKHLARQYKFYLSFENSLCKDYATEKFFLPLTVGLVPVVFGGSDYSKIAPKESYINALDFATPLHLAQYLKEVGSNFTLYKRYLQWNEDFYMDPKFDFAYAVCDVCAKLLSNWSAGAKNYTNVIDWWFNDAPCWSWHQP